MRVETSGCQHRVPNCGCSLTLNRQTAQSEPARANAVHQFNASDRDRRVPEALEAQHHSDTLLLVPMVLLNQVVQVLR